MEGAYLTVTDPQGIVNNYQAYFLYNEPWRRSCEIRRVLFGEPTAFTTATGHGFNGGALAPALRPLTHLNLEQTIGPDSTTHLVPGAFHGYEFDGKAGGVVTVTMSAATCGALDTYLYLYGPKNTVDGSYGRFLVNNDDVGGTCGLNSQIRSFTLPQTGNYLIVATSFRQAGTGDYQLNLHCENGTCAP
ncbi:MAG TPA: PPC domain-containing protein [Kofleriaceae bacterium]|nr:PPC domain-containing protein [Kofleriaceae bacterium]